MGRFRIFPEIPWLLVGIATMAIIAGGVTARCRAEERPVIENSLGMKLVSIPAGEFLMGATEEDVARCLKTAKNSMEKSRAKGDDNPVKGLERQIEQFNSLLPQHRVVITRPFFLGAYPVTQQEFTKVMGFNPSAFWANSKAMRLREKVAGQDTSRHPAENMTWEDAAEFCRQLSALPEEVAAGRTYRLPTEAEWEYACRAGTTTNYYWGDKTKPEITADYTWGSGNSGQKTHPVGEKKPNPWGLFDMIGNVAEWCADWYDPQTYATSPLHDPTGPTSGIERVMRGRGWFAEDVAGKSCTSWVRSRQLPSRREAFWGFRVACDVSAPVASAEETKPEPTATQSAEARLKEKGLSRRMGFFLLPDEASFIRYCSTIERLRVNCFRAQKECQDANRQVSYASSAQAGAIRARMGARSAIGYSDTWREHWAAVRARNQASDAMMLVDLSKEGVQKWQQDAQADLDSAVELFAGQIDKLQKMYEKLQTGYAKLYEDKTVKHTLADLNKEGKVTYRLGPTPSAAAAMKKLEHEQGLLAQFQKP